MKHIKVCKPKAFSKDKAASVAQQAMKLVNGVKTFIPTTEGLGCIPTGNIIDRD